MNDTNNTELLEALKEMPHGKLTAAVILLSTYFVSENMQERMFRAAEYLHNTISTIKPCIGEQLLLLTYKILEEDGMPSLFGEANPHIEKLNATLAEGSSILISGVEHGLFEPDDIREYFNHLHELSRLIMLPESDNRSNNEGVDRVLGILESLQQSV
jgi:hypothetical protein